MRYPKGLRSMGSNDNLENQTLSALCRPCENSASSFSFPKGHGRLAPVANWELCKVHDLSCHDEVKKNMEYKNNKQCDVWR